MEIRKTEEKAEKAEEKQLAEETEEVEKANKKEERKRELEIGIIEEKEISKLEQEKTGQKTLQQKVMFIKMSHLLKTLLWNMNVNMFQLLKFQVMTYRET